MMNISFVGLGKLGLPLATCLAEAQNNIFALDISQQLISKLRKKKLPFYEKDLEKLFLHNYNKFECFTSDYNYAIENTQATIILVNTQMGDKGYSTRVVETALSQVSKALASKKDYHLIILSSTVPPGSCSKLIKKIEEESGKKYGDDFGFTYVPDFVRLGNVIHDFKNPEFFMVGGNIQKDIDTTINIFRDIHDCECKTFTCSLEEAEVSKVSLNAYIVMKISFANFLGMVCSGLENVNVHNVTKIIGNDKRISPYFFGSGTPYGGTCFPRDTAAFIDFAKSNGYNAKHIEFCEEVNDMLQDKLIEDIEKEKVESIGILGLSFKPGSPVAVASPSTLLMHSLIEKYNINVFDHIEETYDNINKDGVNCWLEAQDCIDNSDLVIIMHPDKRFTNLNYDNCIVIDPWGVIN